MEVILNDSQINPYTEDIKELESPSFPQIWTIYNILSTSITLDESQFKPE